MYSVRSRRLISPLEKAGERDRAASERLRPLRGGRKRFRKKRASLSCRRHSAKLFCRRGTGNGIRNPKGSICLKRNKGRRRAVSPLLLLSPAQPWKRPGSFSVLTRDADRRFQKDPVRDILPSRNGAPSPADRHRKTERRKIRSKASRSPSGLRLAFDPLRTSRKGCVQIGCSESHPMSAAPICFIVPASYGSLSPASLTSS